MIESEIVVPFLKWAGGKRWLVSTCPDIFPKKYNRYFEPFLGSGAVFFHMAPREAILSDMNFELIQTYQAIKDDWERVYRDLKIHHKLHSKEYYYQIRGKRFLSPYKIAAQFIYLNRTCWNGLYRVNLKGEFNVPKGTKSAVILDTDNFEKISKILSGAKLVVEDFEEIIEKADKDDFLFVDPPYTVTHNHNGFYKYNEKLFSRKDQKRLRDTLISAAERGVKILATNANHEYIRSLYRSEFFLHSISRSSVIASDNNNRGFFSELLITRN